MQIKTKAGFFLISIILLTTFNSCREKSLQQLFKVDPAFYPYISGFSGGMISSKAEIKIRFAFEPQGVKALQTPLQEELFKFSPSIKGETFWVDRNTIVFKPAEQLSQDKLYQVNFAIGKVIDMPEKMDVFQFNFKTHKQAAEIVFEGIKANDESLSYEFTGTIFTADYIGSDTIQKAFSAVMAGNTLSDISWKHSGGNTKHQFTIKNIARSESSTELNLFLSSDKTGISKAIDYSEKIPALQTFRILQTQLINEDEPYVQIWFSDRLMQNQDLDGLLSTNYDYEETPGWSIEGNLLRIYPSRRTSNNIQISLHESIKNEKGNKLGKEQKLSVNIPDAKPSVNFLGGGVITPTDEGAMIYFRTAHLKAVDVKILKIYESNIPQFLQESDLSGGYDLVRVGKVIKKTTVYLPVEDLQDRRFGTSHALRLDELIKSEPGAIYRVSLSFKKEYATYPCAGSEPDGVKLASIERDENDNPYAYRHENVEHYEEYEADYYYDEDGEIVYNYDWDYHWSQRNNPCSPFYYSSNNGVSKNLLASNLALTCKLGNDRKLYVFANDILSGRPLSGVKIKLLDYQQQTIIAGSTSNDGVMIKQLKNEDKPHLIAASHNNQSAYLKIQEYQSLSTSNFDVSGAYLAEGIKGFIYGERGVWRPGDTLFLSFVLNDRDNPLPVSYPIVMELLNPKWQVISKQVQTKRKEQSLFSFAVPTDPDAITGNYTVRIKVGNQDFSKSLKVETIMPNRLKIDVKHEGEYLSVAKGSNSITMSVKWLHGAPAPGLKTVVNASFSPMGLNFKQFEDYQFENPIHRYQSDEVNIFDDNLDREGKATIPVNVSGNNLPPKINLAMNIRVFEQGGAFSVDRFNVPYFTFSNYVGLKLPKGKGYNNALDIFSSHRFDFVSVDEKGSSTAKENISVRIFRFNYNWWWQYGDDSRNLFDAESTDLVLDTIITTNASGKAMINFKAEADAYGDYYVVAKNTKGHSSGKIFTITDGRNEAPIRDQANRNANQLNFSDLKSKYQTGEDVEVNIPAPEQSHVLLCLENSRGIQKMEWLKAGSDGLRYKFKATADMTPNVYISTTIIQPYRTANNDLPIRRYGIAPIMVEEPESHLVPIIKAPEQTRPDTKVKISVAEEKGRDMEYTLAIVDEGLLDLTRFKTPDPWNEMYAKIAHGVRTWDLYDMISGAFTGRLESVASIGGDDDGGSAKGNAKANRFKPMVRFLGPFNLAKGKQAEHTVHIPEYIGSVRIMVVASNTKGAYGSAKKEMQVSQPLMLLATMPRVISPEEEFLVPVSVFFDGKSVKNASVSISHNNMFTTQSAKQLNIRYNGETEEMAFFTLKAAAVTGIGKVKVTAVSGNEKSNHEIEIDVRAPNPPIVLQEEQMVEAGQSFSFANENEFIAGTDVHWIELSTIPPINLNARLRYLIQYPHGCIEQTTSGAFPQLYVGDLMELSPFQKREIDKHIKAAINRIYKFQTGSGGLSYWPGLSTDDHYATSFAGHFLIEAMTKGYQVNKGFMEKWKKFQKEASKRYNNNPNRKNNEHFYNDDLVQAYRLFTLALSGSPDFASMNKLRESGNLSTMAAWRLAAAYQLAGQREAANRLIGALPGTAVKNSTSWQYNYGSQERDEAVILEVLTLMDQKQLAAPLVKSLSESLRSERWMSTQTTAYTLLSISKFFGDKNSSSNIQAEVYINGKMQAVKSGRPLTQINIEKPGKKLDIKVLNKGKGALFARVVSTGIPPARESKSSQSNLVMNIQFNDAQGRSVDFNNLAQSTDFVAQITVKHPGTKGVYTNLALNAMFASGFEIGNARLDETVNDGSSFDYQDIRDDRVLTYFSLSPNQSKTFRFRLNATYAGRFYMPAIVCEAMYDNTVAATSSGKWIEVKRLAGPGGI